MQHARGSRAVCGASLLAGILVVACRVVGADVEIHVQADKPVHAVSPRLYGIFFEDINFAGDGGLNAELIKNGAFEFPTPMMGWSEVRDEATQADSTVTNDAPWRAANPTFLRLTAKGDGDVGVANEGFRGIGVNSGERYVFACQARGVAGHTASLVVRLTVDGATLAEAPLSVSSSDWHSMRATLEPNATATKAQLQIILRGVGTVDVDMASLVPEKTWKGRNPGQRADLVQRLADLRPAFLRFPGGCIVEGSQLKYRYQWKATLGDPSDRRLLLNRWNEEFAHRPTPDYYQSFGLGFYEFFLLSEEIGAAPLPILNCGMACQFNSKELVPLDELEPFIQDALDLIEFANGPVDSSWGARRAALGHPAPFKMSMLGVGNEQWGAQYFERYERFAKVLKQKYPEVQLVTGAGPFPVGPDYDFAWSRLKALDPKTVDIVDEHCYAGPDWFLRESTRFDDYDRKGPKIFMGEYAAQSIDIVSPENRNNWRCALAEAAFMTGLERNSDVVAMSSYAPLLGHEDAWQWRPNLIWFDNLRSYSTPNYYVQQLFSLHRADEVLPLAINDPRPAVAVAGRIGVGSDNASIEVKGIRVARSDQELWSAEEMSAAVPRETFRGRWNVVDGVLAQSSHNESCRTMFGDLGWQDYTLTLQVRKTGGEGGPVVYVRGTPGGSSVSWKLGGPNNSTFALVSALGRHSTENQVVAETPGKIDDDIWHQVKIELAGPRISCSLDGRLVHEATVQPLNLPRVYAVAGRANSKHEVVLKLAHVADEPVDAHIRLDGVRVAEGAKAEVIELAGDPEAVNSFDEPTHIAPKSSDMSLNGSVVVRRLPANSLTILRIPVE